MPRAQSRVRSDPHDSPCLIPSCTTRLSSLAAMPTRSSTLLLIPFALAVLSIAHFIWSKTSGREDRHAKAFRAGDVKPGVGWTGLGLRLLRLVGTLVLVAFAAAELSFWEGAFYVSLRSTVLYLACF